MEPRQIGRYQIRGQLGRGGMGSVFRAYDPQVDRPVALKVIPISDPVRRARFQREVRAAGRLIHPNIVTIFDAGEEGDTAFIVMELVEGGTLTDRLRQGMTWRQVVSMLMPVCQALGYAHAQDVVHRDLKPANILITHQNVPKLSDFGLAYLSAEATLTPSDAAVGTPGYMAPEQLRGKPTDHRCDLFSLGVILFEGVAGRHPFKADSVEAMLYQIANDTPVDLGPLKGMGPPALIQVIRRAMAKDRETRYATSGELADALAACLSEEGSETDVIPAFVPSASPEIRRTPGVSLSEGELRLLARAFAGSDEVFVERELPPGFSGARLFLVRPGSSQAQIVVKLAPPDVLHREWDAYRALVEDFSPQNTARVQGEPVVSDDGQRALLRYTFAGGDPRRPTRSLRTYFQEKGGTAAVEVLDRVIRVYGRQWWSRNIPRTFALSEEYDRLLPVHLKLRLDTEDQGAASDTETPLALAAGRANAPALGELRSGQHVRLLGFRVDEVRPEQGDMTLTAPSPKGEASAHLRVRVEDIDQLSYRPGDQVASLKGVVTATRHDLLVDGAQAGFPKLDLGGEEIRLANVTCPNPLSDYPELLNTVTDAGFSTIHGDLNLENILVDSATGFAWLIDFAETRQGPALYDLQRLEAQVITKLLAPAVSQEGLGPEVMVDLYQDLHAEQPGSKAPHPVLQEAYTLLVGIRRLARQFLMDDMDWDEYHRGLILTLLGAMKFAELDVTARSLAFAGAAAARRLIGTPVRVGPPISDRTPALRPLISVALALLVLLMVAIPVTLGLGWLSGSDLLARLLGGSPLPASRMVQSDSEPLAIIAGVSGRVEVRRQAEDRVQPAVFGLDLFLEDAVLTYDQATANVLCQNGLLFNVGSGKVWTVRCQESDEARTVGQLDSQLSAQLVQTGEESPIALASDQTRAARSEDAQIPLLLSPRNTLVAEAEPTFSWQPVPGASGYRLSLSLPTGKTWSRETTDTSLPYPSDEASLEPGSANIVTLVALDEAGTESAADKSLLRVLDEASRAELAEAEAAIQNLDLDELTQSYLLAQLYRGQGLSAAAIVQLERLTSEGVASADLWQQLGDLYFDVNLYAQAEESYQKALTAAEDGQDPGAQAAARVGLGRVADVYDERERAINHLRQAEDLYRAVGDQARAEAVAQILAELEASLEVTPGQPSPTSSLPPTTSDTGALKTSALSSSVSASSQKPEISAAGTESPPPTQTPETPTATFTLLPSVAPSASSPTEPSPPTCQIAITSEFQALWAAHTSELGCPTGPLYTIPFFVEEAFQGGHLFWREDTDDVYLVYDRGQDGIDLFQGEWHMPPWKWDEVAVCDVGTSPPPGLYRPERGFGWLWCTHLGGPDGPLGWALDREYGHENMALVQPFEHGLMLMGSELKVYALLDGDQFFAQR